MTDVGFPVIEYSAAESPREWGRQHGETWREAIGELVAIRSGLMLEKNPRLGPATIPDLARQQWKFTAEYDADLAAELQGIAEGAGCSLDDIVILNNYTDFRDIQIDNQGCSAAFVNRDGNVVAGQTWDMHGSAKRFVCCLKIPSLNHGGDSVLFSIVGCVGMMGFNASGMMVGVNNINTDGARPGILWPVLIRKLVEARDHEEQVGLLHAARLTSGRSFLLADRTGASFWEVMPGLCERVSLLHEGQAGHLFHTNHCLGELAKTRETAIALTSTTHIRFDLLDRKIARVSDFGGMYDLMNDHEGYPKSICSNFQTSSQDPSITCGGAVGDLNTGRVRMWRGDAVHDNNFLSRDFQV